jgi:hypothetical protein
MAAIAHDKEALRRLQRQIADASGTRLIRLSAFMRLDKRGWPSLDTEKAEIQAETDIMAID